MAQPIVEESQSSPALPTLRAGERLDRRTFHERYSAMPSSFRAELVGGVVRVSSPVFRPHARTHASVVGWLFVYMTSTPGLQLADNGTLFLGDDNEFQPDAVLFIEPDRGGKVRFEGKALAGAPELAVEVADSTQSQDLRQKRLEYEAAGVPEYIVCDLAANRVHWFALRGEYYVHRDPDADGILRSDVFPGLWLDPSALLSGDSRRVLEVLQSGLATPDHQTFAMKLGKG
jgi:Uma2 family endonuclease